MLHRLTAVVLAVLYPTDGSVASQVVVTSRAPYWTVGQRDDALSRACALGRFRPAKAGELVAEFKGSRGAEVLDVAKSNGANLFDPGRRAKPGEDYFFRKSGTTSCEVFVGGRGAGPSRPRLSS